MQQRPTDQSENESRMRRRVVGFFMFPVALFPFLALCTYDWHSISDLCIPPAPTSNLIGVAGDWFAYIGYQFFGLGVWFAPVICVYAGLRLVLGNTCHPGRRTLGVSLFVFAATCLLQVAGASTQFAPLLRELNIAPNAGGAIGYLVMTRGLVRHLAPFGACVLMASLAAFSLLVTIGPHNVISAFAKLTDWAADRHTEDGDANEAGAVDAARAARDAAKAERIAEKERIAAEKAAANAAARAAREERKAALIAEREAARKEKEEQRRKEEDEIAAVRERLRAEQAPIKPAQEEPAPKPQPKPAPVPTPATPVSAEQTKSEMEDKGPYILPPVELLNPVPQKDGGPGENVSAMAQRLIDTLKVFDVNAELAYYVAGPVVTQYALTLDLGTRVEKVAGLARNLQMALQATSLRIEAPIPGKNAVGIEVPNLKPASVHFREIIDGDLWRKNSPGKFQLPLLLGKDAAGNDLVVDLAKLPHMLVAGATGQGKSVCLNSIINGLLMCRTPEQLRFIMVDPKRVEFVSYNQLPHLLVPIINDTKKVVFALRAALVEMEKRLRMFSRAGCRNIVDFNTRTTVSQPDMFGGEEAVGDKDIPRTIPYIVIIIDEVADVMQAAGKEVEPVIARLTALARATGIHLILATQRPDTKVITGTIKSNIPGRIAFKTSSSIDSRTILDAQGSEQLIGKGDMLFKMADGRLLRAQGSYIADEEINRIIEFIGEHSNPNFDEALTKRMEKIKEADPSEALDEEMDDETPPPNPAPEPMATEVVGGVPPPAGMTASKEEGLFRRALEVLRDTKRASISHLQRRMGIGYNHAARIMDLLEERGIIGPTRGAGPREILIDPETLLNGGVEASDAPADGSQEEDGTAFALPPDPSEG